jgi:Ser/Thr protein kinase RdoA (MazF antagonist)
MEESSMNTELNERLREVIARYPIGTLDRSRMITDGLIHQTYLVELISSAHHRKDRAGLTPLIFQRLHPKLSTSGMLSDFERVTQHLDRLDYGGPTLVRAQNGDRSVIDAEGFSWRVSTFVSGETFNEVHSEELARVGGRGLATFHRLMERFESPFESTHPGHDTEGHWRGLRAASQRPEFAEHWHEISALGEQVLSALSDTFLPKNLPKSVVHGDPKINNLRFQRGALTPDTGRANTGRLDQENSDHRRLDEGRDAVIAYERAVMIDLDTCTRHTRLVDLGDAIRSWCHRPQEKLGDQFSLERCIRLLEGYLEEASPLTSLERVWLPRCGRVITLELTCRFLKDVLENHYFAYDERLYPSRRAHNLARAQEMWSLAEEMRVAEPQLNAWLQGR